MKRSTLAAVAAWSMVLSGSLGAADALLKEMKGRWRTSDGQYSNAHEVKILGQQGDQITGTLQTWSGRCKGAIAPFKGTFDGTTLIIATGADSPCAPVAMELKKEPKTSRYSGAWQVPDFKGSAYLE